MSIDWSDVPSYPRSSEFHCVPKKRAVPSAHYLTTCLLKIEMAEYGWSKRHYLNAPVITESSTPCGEPESCPNSSEKNTFTAKLSDVLSEEQRSSAAHLHRSRVRREQFTIVSKPNQHASVPRQPTRFSWAITLPARDTCVIARVFAASIGLFGFAPKSKFRSELSRSGKSQCCFSLPYLKHKIVPNLIAASSARILVPSQCWIKWYGFVPHLRLDAYIKIIDRSCTCITPPDALNLSHEWVLLNSLSNSAPYPQPNPSVESHCRISMPNFSAKSLFLVSVANIFPNISQCWIVR
jgi:hypothetical protein